MPLCVYATSLCQIYRLMQMLPVDVNVWLPPLPASVPSCWTWNQHLELPKLLQPLCTPCSTHEESLSCRCCGPLWPDPRRHHAYVDHSCHTPSHSSPWINPYTHAQHSSTCLHIRVMEFTYQSQSINSGRSDCFFKCADTFKSLQGSWRIREACHHQGNTVNFQ